MTKTMKAAMKIRGSGGVKPHQPAARRGGAEHAQGRGRVPALFVMVKIDAAGDPRLGLEAGDVGADEILSAAVEHLTEREQRRDQRRRGVPAHRVADIVEIERVRRGAVDQRGVERRCPAVAAEDQACAAAGADHAGDDRGTRLAGAGEGDADRVENRRPGPIDRLGRQLVIAGRGNVFGEGFEDGHTSDP